MEPFTAMVEFADFRKRVGKSIGIREWFREMMACKCKFYLGGKDFGPIRGFLFSWLADKFSRSANEVVAENTNNHEKGCK